MPRSRHVVKVAAHLALVFIGFIGAYEVRRGLPLAWWISDPLAFTILKWALVYTVIAGVIEALLRNERTAWRFASVREALRLALACASTGAAFLALVFLTNRAIVLPRSTLVLSTAFSLLLLVGIRLLWRSLLNPSLVFNEVSFAKSGAPLTLVGGVAQAESYLRRWLRDAQGEYRPVCIVTTEKEWAGQMIHGVRVVAGPLNPLLETATERFGEEPRALLFLSDPVLKLGFTTAEIGRLRSKGYRLLRQVDAIELSDQSAAALREIKLEEFLPRAPVELDTEALIALIAGKRVLVTGAGGSIGSELARQLVRFGCSHITLVDHSEFALFEIDRELSVTEVERTAALCNVRDAQRLREIFRAERPQLVFHAAALKHVTLVEQNVAEGVLTNVLGTWNVAGAAVDAGVRHMVLISTDKAVDPSSMMGCTKRIAEALLGSKLGSETQFSVVRFGNVLGSAGSVVPIFREQIERGGPVTITHPDVERYFMTIPEAVQLVLQATALRMGDERRSGLRKFVLEMGKPVRIVDLARQMIELSGSGGKVDIEFCGLRNGEKLTETLLDEGECAQRCLSGITEIEATGPHRVVDADEVAALVEMASSGERAAIRARVKSLVQAIRQAGGAEMSAAAGAGRAAELERVSGAA